MYSRPPLDGLARHQVFEKSKPSFPFWSSVDYLTIIVQPPLFQKKKRRGAWFYLFPFSLNANKYLYSQPQERRAICPRQTHLYHPMSFFACNYPKFAVIPF